MSYSFAEEQEAPSITPAVQWLIAINVVIYFLQLTMVNAADIAGALGFTLADLPGAWWTIATYAFVHADFWHLAFNMLLLWLFGRSVEHVWSSGKFVGFYLWCALGGVVFHPMFARESMLVGASAAVLGVMLAYAMRWPDREILFMLVVPMKVKWLVALIAVLHLVLGLAGFFAITSAGSGGTAYMAHVGGLAFAWLYLRTPSAQSIDRLRQRVSQIPDVPDDATPRAVPRSLPRPRERASETDEIVAKSKAVVAKRPAIAAPVRPARDPKREQLDSLLDKISEHGMGSLTAEEKRMLEEMARKLQG